VRPAVGCRAVEAVQEELPHDVRVELVFLLIVVLDMTLKPGA
jgi:hypothetical protein